MKIILQSFIVLFDQVRMRITESVGQQFKMSC